MKKVFHEKNSEEQILPEYCFHLEQIYMGTYKVRNETKRNEINENETKRNEINKNETKRNEINEMKTKPTKAKRNQRKQNEIRC